MKELKKRNEHPNIRPGMENLPKSYDGTRKRNEYPNSLYG